MTQQKRVFISGLPRSNEDESDYILSSLFKMPQSKGYSVWLAAVFIASFIAGMGVLALPHALAGTGWFGLLLILLGCINSWYCALILGRTWMIMEERWEEYRGKFRYPYPAMAQRAFGPWMRYVVTALLHVSFIGIAVVYILLAAEIAQSMAGDLITIGYSYWIIILAAILCPLSWFGSLEEFWFAAVGALATASLACVGMFAGLIIKIPKTEQATYGNTTFSSACLAFGTILFSFGGSFLFPTIQNDMAKKEQFPKATLLGFGSVLILFLPVTLAGYAIIGYSVPINILEVIEEGALKTFIEACLAIHLFLAFLITINPVAQEAEEAFNVNPDFNYKRCIIRSLVVGFILLFAYAIPHFDKVMNLIGGSTFTTLVFVLPPIIYFRIHKDSSKPDIEYSAIPLPEKLFLIEIIIIGVAGGIACTYFAVLEIVHIFVNT